MHYGSLTEEQFRLYDETGKARSVPFINPSIRTNRVLFLSSDWAAPDSALGYHRLPMLTHASVEGYVPLPAFVQSSWTAFDGVPCPSVAYEAKAELDDDMAVKCNLDITPKEFDGSPVDTEPFIWGGEPAGLSDVADEVDTALLDSPSSSVTAQPPNHDFTNPWEEGHSARSASLTFTAPPEIAEMRTMFFYGTLTLPHVLQMVLSLPVPPELQPAAITGYALWMWGPYPALVPITAGSEQVTVNGKAYSCTLQQVQRLQRYEGDNYKPEQVKVSTGGREVDGWTFVWCGHIEKLRTGTFVPTIFPA